MALSKKGRGKGQRAEKDNGDRLCQTRLTRSVMVRRGSVRALRWLLVDPSSAHQWPIELDAISATAQRSSREKSGAPRVPMNGGADQSALSGHPTKGRRGAMRIGRWMDESKTSVGISEALQACRARLVHHAKSLNLPRGGGRFLC